MKCTLMNLVFAVLTIGCSKEMSWEAPSAGLITRNTAALFYIVPDNTPGVVWFYMGDLNSSASHTSNPKTRNFDYSGTLTTDTKAVVPYELKSVSSGVIMILDKIYDLSEGRVFVIAEDGGITQIPFAPLKPSDAYLTQLEEYMNASKSE